MLANVLAQSGVPLNFSALQQMGMANGAVGRLLVACLLGGMIGLERGLTRKAAGVRTNMLICMGAAMFTLLSMVLAGDGSADKSRVASNIVQGIGFLGAGLILHNRNRVSGLTSAACVFVVASIGMASGTGLYAVATMATIIVIASLRIVGLLERKANLKSFPQIYEVRGSSPNQMMASILSAMDKVQERLYGVECDSIGTVNRVSFTVTASQKQHGRLHEALLGECCIDKLLTHRDPEED